MLRKTHLYFVLACICIVAFVFWEHPSVVSKWMHTNAQGFYLTKSLVLVGAEGLLIVSLFLASRSYCVFKYLYLFLVLLSALIFDVFYFASGKVIEFQDFVLLISSLANTKDAVLMYGGWIGWASLRGLVLIAGFVLMPPPLSTHLKRNAIFSFLIGIILVCLVCATCVFRQGGATNKLPSPISLYGLFLAYGIDRVKNPYSYHYELTKEIQISHAQYQHIVLVIDESIRFDYSPFLRLKNFGQWSVMDFGRATSYANSSAVSNIMLRKGVRYESIVEDFYHNALIWDYAKKAGYKTYLYDAQGGGRGHDYFDRVEEKMIDNNLSNVAIESDDEIISSLEYLKTKQKTFTIIIKKGAHFPYNAFSTHYQFPSEIFSGYFAQTLQRVKYLKSVLYQSDRFCSELLKFQTQESTLIIYTSDHGQNLEDVAGLTHGSTQNPYSGEGLVPLVVLSNVQNTPISKHLQNNFNRSSHFNIFPTILEAMGFDSKNLGYLGYSGSLYGEVKEVGGFFYGIPFGYFGKKPDFQKVNGEF